MALNAPIQGSAADLVKVAMLGVDRALAAEGLASRMLLQVHDELVLEVAPGERDAVEALVRREMGAAYELPVPLDVSVGVGRPGTTPATDPRLGPRTPARSRGERRVSGRRRSESVCCVPVSPGPSPSYGRQDDRRRGRSVPPMRARTSGLAAAAALAAGLPILLAGLLGQYGGAADPRAGHSMVRTRTVPSPGRGA